jgi:uncharacterized protein (DUF1330 family)
MKTRSAVTLALLAGAAFGAAGMQALNAQAKPPAYLVSEIEVTDEAAYARDYAPKIPPIINSFGGKFLVRAGRTETFDGPPPPKRVVIVQFESMEKAKAFRESPAFKALRPVGEASSKLRQFSVEGAAN